MVSSARDCVTPLTDGGDDRVMPAFSSGQWAGTVPRDLRCDRAYRCDVPVRRRHHGASRRAGGRRDQHPPGLGRRRGRNVARPRPRARIPNCARRSRHSARHRNEGAHRTRRVMAGTATISPARPIRWRPGPSAAAARCCSWACRGRRSSRRPGRSTPSASPARRDRWRRRLRPSNSTPAGRFFAAQGVEILHYKCCSTFDSAPHVGNIGAAVRALQRHFPNPLVPIVGGQPNLGRYCLFGTLFAAAGAGGDVYRIDRHPTMSVHPVTPMGEADLRKHFAKQGLERIGLIDYRVYVSERRGCARLDACLANSRTRFCSTSFAPRICRSSAG